MSFLAWVLLGVLGFASAGAGSPAPVKSKVVVVRVTGKQSAALAGSFRPFTIKFPEDVSPQSFTNRATVDVEILKDGQVGTVKLVKSTGVPEVDQQVQAGVKGWRFPPGKQKLYLYLTLFIEIR